MKTRLVWKSLVVSLLCIVITCVGQTAQAAPQGRIINGHPTTQSWPWMASLSMRDSEPSQTHFCGGALIDPMYVVTAAHCVFDYSSSPESLQIVLGRTRLTGTDGVTAYVSPVIIHPDFDFNTLDSDIALLRLESPVTDIEPIAPVSPAEEAMWGADTSATLIGWGVTDGTIPIRPDHLQEAQMPIHSFDQCLDTIGLDFKQSSMMCAGKLASSQNNSDGIDACNGDSGSPLMVFDGNVWKVIGLTSWGYDCGSSRAWGVYARVSRFLEWIHSKPIALPYIREGEYPYVSGVPQVGQTLRCNKGNWQGENISSYTYQWIDSESGRIARANKITYKVRPSDMGRQFNCSVTATNPGGSATADSDLAGPIFPQLEKVSHKGNKRSLVRTVGKYCNDKGCTVVLIARSQIRFSRVLDTGASRSTISWVDGKMRSSNVWSFKLQRRTRGSVYIRVIEAIGGKSEVIEVVM